MHPNMKITIERMLKVEIKATCRLPVISTSTVREKRIPIVMPEKELLIVSFRSPSQAQ